MVGGDGAVGGLFGIGAAGLEDLPDRELSAVGGGRAGGVVADFAEHFGGFIDIDAGFDADEGIGDVALGGLVGDRFLSFHRSGVVRGGGVFADDVVVGIEGVEEVAFSFEELGVAIRGIGGDGGLGVGGIDGAEGFAGLFGAASLLVGDALVVEVLGDSFAAAGLGSELGGFFIAAAGKEEESDEDGGEFFDERGHGREDKSFGKKGKRAFLRSVLWGGCARVTAMRKFGSLLEWGLRIPLGGFFVWSGVMKLLDLRAFTEAVGNFQMEFEERIFFDWERFFGAPGDAYLAYGVPWLEVMAGLALVTGFGKRGGLVVLGGLLVMFNLALWSAWDRGIVDLNCGCHGKSDDPTDYAEKIASNFGLLAVVLLIAGIVWGRGRLTEKGVRS